MAGIRRTRLLGVMGMGSVCCAIAASARAAARHKLSPKTTPEKDATSQAPIYFFMPPPLRHACIRYSRARVSTAARARVLRRPLEGCHQLEQATDQLPGGVVGVCRVCCTRGGKLGSAGRCLRADPHSWWFRMWVHGGCSSWCYTSRQRDVQRIPLFLHRLRYEVLWSRR